MRPKNPAAGLLMSGAALLLVASIVVSLSIESERLSLTLPIVVQAVIGMIATRAIVARAGAVSVCAGLIIGFEIFRGCAVPLLVQIFGQEQPKYRQLGTYSDAAEVLWIGVGFFASITAVFVVYALVADASRRQRVDTVAESKADVNIATGGGVAMVGLGIVGLVMRFPDASAIGAFLSGDYDGLQTAPQGGLLGFASAVLRPLLPLGLALIMVRAHRESRRVPFLLWPLLAGAIVFALGSYGLNRAAVLLPTAAFIVASARYLALRIRPMWVVVSAGAAAAMFIGLGGLRESLYAERIGDGAARRTSFVESIVQTVILYGQSPIQVAPAIAASREGIWAPETLVNSLLSPIPGAPDDLRSHTGTVIYNQLLYQSSIPTDQIIPSWAEVYFSTGFLGLAAIGMFVGVLALSLDRAVHRSRILVRSYSLILAVLIIGQISISSISATLQNLVYFVAVPMLMALSVGLVPRRQYVR